MRKVVRLAGVLALLVTVTFLFVHIVYKSENSSQASPFATTTTTTTTKHTNIKTSTTDEKFMSYFPHGDFASQHEAVRNALRIALETNRTLILPQVRLGTKDIPWAPYPLLQKYYESQDKESLKATCLSGMQDWRTEYQPCADLDQWIELPWSTFFDLQVLKTKYGIRVSERKWGHGWGVKESILSHLELTHQDVVAVDPTSFASNGSDWDDHNQQKVMHGGGSSWFNLLPASSGRRNEAEASTTLTAALKLLVTSDQLLQLDETYIQFGSLLFGLRFQTKISKQQTALQIGLRSTVFTSPNQLAEANLVAQKITATMGGADMYNVIHMNIDAVTRIELANQIAMNQENAEIEGKPFINHVKEKHADGTPYSPLELLQQLDNQTQTELMISLVRELEGDMPIHQALAAAMPFEDSELKGLSQQPSERSTLLSACTRYRETINTAYPVYYMTNDVYSEISAHPELFGPMLDAFPCTFTPNDMYSWGVIKRDWASRIPDLNDPNVDYEAMLSPITEILIARQGYSFFEVPTTKLTRLLAWH